MKSVIDKIDRFRFLMSWSKPEDMITGGSFIEVNEQEFVDFTSKVNYRRISYSDCTIYCNAKGFGQEHLAYHYDNGWNPNRYLIKQ